MTIAQQLVDEARTWKGTRFVHQGRLKGVGVDCVGFISEVASGAGVKGITIPCDYKPHEDGVLMLRLLKDHLSLIEDKDMQPGDVLALCDEHLRAPNIPRHVVIVTDVTPRTTFIIHASQHGVVEHRIDSRWRKRIHSTWRIKE